jgi:hypothetical protein
VEAVSTHDSVLLPWVKALDLALPRLLQRLTWDSGSLLSIRGVLLCAEDCCIIIQVLQDSTLILALTDLVKPNADMWLWPAC